MTRATGSTSSRNHFTNATEGLTLKDLTQASIGRHILLMALPIAAGMFFQTLYFLIDLYFVAHLGVRTPSCRHRAADDRRTDADGVVDRLVSVVRRMDRSRIHDRSRRLPRRGAILQIISWNFIASGFVFTCSAIFHGLGNTVPSVVSSASRIVSLLIPALWLAAQPDFQPLHLWYVSVASQAVQVFVSVWLVRRAFRRLPRESC